ncbi:MAG: aminopeptidase P family protein [Inquilinus sp.]|nr:aminopeptidase P family protein [Inquilinus sp.]
MPIHFAESELADRRARACAAMAARGLDGMLLFRQESLYYLTGYDTFGYVYFQCLFLGADGAMTLLTRAPDLRQAHFTSVIEDVWVWTDEQGATPEARLLDILVERGAKGKRLGVEWHAYGLTAQLGFRLAAALDGFCATEDASDLVSRLRLVKSPAELGYVRRAGELADAAYDEARRLAAPGAFEGDILAAMQGAVFRGGGDDPANETIIGSGPGALMCRYFTGRRHLAADDQLTLEFAGVYRHYHACLMRTIRIGEPPPHQVAMHAAALDSLAAAKAALKPGRPIGEVFDAHATVLDRAGLGPHRMNACGYSLGATYAPNWMDWPMFYRGNPEPAAPGMVFFIHIIVFDSDAGLAMTSGQTVEVTAEGCAPLTHAPLELAVR